MLRRGYELPPLMFTEDEAEAIAVGLRLLAQSFSIPETVIARWLAEPGRLVECHTGYAAVTSALAVPRRRVWLALVPYRLAANRCTIPARRVVAIPFARATSTRIGGVCHGLRPRR